VISKETHPTGAASDALALTRRRAKRKGKKEVAYVCRGQSLVTWANRDEKKVFEASQE
jgi:hypothetical protein